MRGHILITVTSECIKECLTLVIRGKSFVDSGGLEVQEYVLESNLSLVIYIMWTIIY